MIALPNDYGTSDPPYVVDNGKYNGNGRLLAIVVPFSTVSYTIFPVPVCRINVEVFLVLCQLALDKENF